MAQVESLNKFNNLLFHRDKHARANESEHRAGRVPLDLSHKKTISDSRNINIE